MFFRIQVFPTEKKPDFVWIFYFQKKLKVFKKSQNFKIWLQKRQIGNPILEMAPKVNKCPPLDGAHK